MDDRLLNICRFFIPPRPVEKVEIHWPTFYIPHYRDDALLPVNKRHRRPRMRFLRDYFGISVSAAERDAAWEEALRLGHGTEIDKKDREIIFNYYFEDKG